MFLKAQSGQTVMEMLVALAALTIGLLGIVGLINASLGLNRVIADNYRATYLASEGIEIIKSLISTNEDRKVPWCSGIPAGTYELDYRLEVPQSGTYDCANPYPFLSPSDRDPLLFHASSHLYDYDATLDAQPTGFYRTVTISYQATPETPLDTDQMIVKSVVRWKDKTGDNEVNLIDYFFNPSSTVPVAH